MLSPRTWSNTTQHHPAFHHLNLCRCKGDALLQEAMDVLMKCAFGKVPLKPLEQLVTPWND